MRNIMSQSENIRAFEAALRESKELQAKFAAAQKRIVENKEASSDGEVLVKAAAEIGFTLSMAELERATAQMQEINDEELKQVSGGFSGGDYAPDNYATCLGAYYCHYVWAHDEDGFKNRACWNDYICNIIVNDKFDLASEENNG